MKKKNAVHISLVVIFLVVIIAFGYLIIREGLSISRQTAEIINIKALIANQQTLLSNMREADKRSEQMEARLLELQNMIPDQPLHEQVLSVLQQCADDAAVKLESVTFGEHIPEDGYVRMPVRISFSGNFKGFLQLLSNLMYADRLVKIESVSLSGSNGWLGIELTAEAFYRIR